jgi:hypothetical protein
MTASSSVTYLTLTDANYFLGAAAMVNSLVLTGHEGRFVVVDTGLEDWQREGLEAVATVVPLAAPGGLPASYLKAYMATQIECDVLVYLDSDVLVTDSLADVVREAVAGRICAAADPQRGRFFPEWAQLMPLEAALRRGETYVNAGVIAIAPARWPGFFERWQELGRIMAEGVPPLHTLRLDDSLRHPGAFHDQDPLNALLMSEIPAGSVSLIDPERFVLSNDMHEVELVDAETLHCRVGEHRTIAMHYLSGPKPWERAGWLVASNNAFVLLLMRLLRSDDVPVHVDDDRLPVWLRWDEGIRRNVLYAGIRGIRASSHAVPSSLRRRLRSFIQHR